MLEYSSIPQISDLRKCRLCFDNQTSLIHIFETTSSLNEVARTISEVLNFEISAEDHFPPFVCSYCSAKLFEFKAFKAKCYSLRETYKLILQRKTESVRKDSTFSVGECPIKTELVKDEMLTEAENYQIPESRKLVWFQMNESEVHMSCEQRDAENVPGSCHLDKYPISDRKLGAGDELTYSGTCISVSTMDFPMGAADVSTPVVTDKSSIVASDPLEGIGNDSEESTKHEIEIEEWEMPLNILPQRNKLESTESCNVKSSDCLRQMHLNYKNVLSKNSSPVVSPSGISRENKAKKDMCEKSIKDDFFTDKESLLTVKSKRGDNSTKSKLSSSKMNAQRKRKRLVCDVCKKSFVTKQSLRNHEKVHCDDRPFKYVERGKSFKQESTKILHELSHVKKENEGDKKRSTKISHVCEICEKKFQRRQSLHQHYNLHINKYLCTFCGKRCGSKSNLGVHLRIHTNEKPFSCEVCKMKFNRKENFKRHLTTHYEDCPFQCNVCDKRFKTKSLKNIHALFHWRRKSLNL